MNNPLVMSRMKKKQDKQAKKQDKKLKKVAKKEKKRLKKAAKKERKAAKKKNRKKGSSSSSSSSSSASGSSGSGANGTGAALAPPVVPQRHSQNSSPERLAKRRRTRSRSPAPPAAASPSLGPSSTMVSKREEYQAVLADRKAKALASRGAPRRMTEEEKNRKFEEMRRDAKLHDRKKEGRIAAAEQREREIEELEARMRQNSDQRYFKEMRAQAFTDGDATVADRLRTQRHRRQKNLNDPLERDQ